MFVFRHAGSLLLLGFICAAAGLVLWHHHHSWEYGLPVALGKSSTDVQRVLGPPTESIDYNRSLSKEEFKFAVGKEGLITRYYYTSGIVGNFKDDKLISMIVPPDNGNTYPGFLPYTGVIIRGLRITDDKQTILHALGSPTKIESDDLPAGTDLNAPVVWPKSNNYYWRFPDYVVQVSFLNQAQSVDDEKHLTLPKDSVIAFEITK